LQELDKEDARRQFSNLLQAVTNFRLSLEAITGGQWRSPVLRKRQFSNPRWGKALNGIRPLARFVLVPIVSGVFVWVFLEPVSRDWIASLESPVADRAAVARRCADSVLLRDDKGHMLGVMRRHQEPDCYGKHMTTEFDDQNARAIAKAIGILEGRFKRTDPTLFGIDMVGFARLACFETERWLRGGFPREHASQGKKKTICPFAGTSPMQSFVEKLAGDPHPQKSLFKKINYLRATAIFEARYLRGNDTLRARFLSGQSPVLEEHGGREYGGRLAAEHLFGGMPTSLGQKCLFAAAAGFPLRMPYDGASEKWKNSVNARLDKAKHRAASKCVPKLARSSEEQDEALQEINAFELPAAHLPRLSEHILMLLEDPLIFPTIDRTDIHLTLDAELQRLVEKSAPLFVQSMVPGRSKPDWLLAVAEIKENGVLELRAAGASRRGLLAGPHRSERGVIRHHLPDIGLGSQAKIPLVLLGTRKGYSELCNRQIGTISNASGPSAVSDCESDPAGFVDIRFATARSMNAPFAALAEDHPADIRDLHNVLNWLGPDMGPTGAALGIGRTPSPSQMMTLAAAIDEGRFGHPLRSRGLSIISSEAGRAIDLSLAGYTALHGSKAAAILRAPLGPDGTLFKIGRHLSDVACRLIWGKSGSPEIAGGTTAMARSATLVAECGTRRFVLFAMITSGDNRLPVNIGTSQLSGMLRPALEYLAQADCATRPGCQISHSNGETS